MAMHRPETFETLAAWVAGACEASEADAVAEHVATCPECTAETARLRAVGDLLTVAPGRRPAELKDDVLAAARQARRPGNPVETPLAAAYDAQIEALDDLLDVLEPATWQAPDSRHGTLEGMLVHLAGNDARLADDLGLPVLAAASADTRELHRRWRVQARALARYTTTAPARLDREVALAGRTPGRGPARDALVQRGFETWIHADDVRLALGLPTAPPPPAQLRRIAELGIGLLPRAMRTLGRHHPGRTARLTLEGDAGGEWVLPLDPGEAPGDPDVAVTAGLEDFTRLLANRRSHDTFPHRAEGDPAIVADMLHVASTLGCD